MLANVGSLPAWLRVAAVLIVVTCIVAAWKWTPRAVGRLDELAAWFAVHRNEWYTLPLVIIAYVVLGLAMVPVVVLIAATGIAFGPVLGPVYAMAGCLVSASVGFAIGRVLGLQRVRNFGGERIVRIARTLKRNGTLAVFLVRKVPAPFTLVNIVVGASPVRYRDFLIGTVLGMSAFVIGLAGFGYQLIEALHDPSPRTFASAALFVLVPLMLALLINTALRRAGSAG